MASSDRFLPIIQNPELFFALVAPVGVDLTLVCDVLEVELLRVRYATKFIKLSSLLHTFELFHDLPRSPEEARYDSHMTAGNTLRARLHRGDALALLAISNLADIRDELTGSTDTPAPRTAYIFRSLKHPDELETLRKVYGSALYVISVYATRESRVRVLSDVFGRSHGEVQSDPYRSAAETVIVRDEAEVYNVFGQNVRETFPRADVFVRADSRRLLEEDVQRFIRLVFGHPFCTPNRVEHGMFHARASALRSSDLSRQVGAVICSEEGDILGLGCNDVPKALGGLYWPDDSNDRRDFVLGYDSSAQMRDDMLRELIVRLQQKQWLEHGRCTADASELLLEALTMGDPPLLKSTQITNLLEFGRPVHAEMAALMDSARLGISVKDGIMYCTTFPCHICARHIVAAGIKQVVYIEPYPKSMVPKLYADSISIDAYPTPETQVAFEPFRGIAPRSFEQLFAMRKRKDESGRALPWKETDAEPILEQIYPAYIEIESQIIGTLRSELEERGLKRVQLRRNRHGETRLAGSTDAAR